MYTQYITVSGRNRKQVENDLFAVNSFLRFLPQARIVVCTSTTSVGHQVINVNITEKDLHTGNKVHFYSSLSCLVERILSCDFLAAMEPSHSVEVCQAQKNSRGTLQFSEPDLYRWLPSISLAANKSLLACVQFMVKFSQVIFFFSVFVFCLVSECLLNRRTQMNTPKAVR